MKKLVFIGLIISMIIGGCAYEETTQIEGAWQLVYGKWRSSGETFPGQITGSGIKMWSKGSFSFAGEFQLDTITIDNGIFNIRSHVPDDFFVSCSFPVIPRRILVLINFRYGFRNDIKTEENRKGIYLERLLNLELC